MGPTDRPDRIGAGSARNGAGFLTPTGLDAPPPGFGPGDAGPTGRSGRRLLGGVAAIVVVVLGILVVRQFVGGSAPTRLSLPPAVDAGSGPVAAGPISGTWTVVAGSQAGYRVSEILFDQQHTAVGRTTKVTGGLTISGTTLTAADFSVDMATVASDQAGRNVQFKDYLMKTGTYPQARFHLTRVVQLGSVPARSQAITETATGQLTLRGVTRLVSFPLRAERTGDAIDVNAEIPVTFSTWHIPTPDIAIARVGREGLIEVLLVMVRDRPRP